MTTLLVSQRNFESHVTPSGHPERPDRLRVIEEALAADRFNTLLHRDAPSGDLTLADLAHAPGYLEALSRIRPAEGVARIARALR